MTTLYYHGDTPGMSDFAKDVLIDLCNAYPGHPWDVECKTNLIFISYLNRNFRARWGMGIRLDKLGYSASAVKAAALHYGGEWLERSGQKRGPVDVDQEILRVEGVKGSELIAPPDPQATGDGMPERTELMPQVFTQ